MLGPGAKPQRPATRARSACYQQRGAMDSSPQHLRIYRSNRLEKLAEALGDVLSEAPADVLAPECIVVPGRGVAQWLSMQLAERFGVWSNVLYLYPRNFVSFALDRVLAKPGKTLATVDPDHLVWTVLSVLEPLLGEPACEALRRYVDADPSRLRYFELCRRIAHTFDRYATYRPDLLQSWERRRSLEGEDASQLALFAGPKDPEAWQPMLWRALHERLGPVYAGALERRFSKGLAQSQRLANLPSRISCFAITHLPPSYARILVMLCPHVTLHMFQLRATEPPAAGVRAKVSWGGARSSGAGGNALVESLGGLALDFDAVLERELSSQDVATRVFDLYAPPTGATLLDRLQRQLWRNQAPTSAERCPISAADESIRIHVCHSPMREIEVLHDQLLALLGAGRGLEARDVVVMLPDVESYAPLIEAVFRRSPGDPAAIPFSIADRSAQRAAPVVDALGRLFALAAQRFSTPQVLDLLALEVVAGRFGITPREVELLTAWLTRSNVRWGRDADHRAAHGHPHSDKTSWRFGLRRLLLGYAMENDPPVLVGGVLPAPEAEGLEAVALGKLCDFVEALFSATSALGEAHTPSAWPGVVGAALDALCVNDTDTAWQHEEVQRAVIQLADNARGAGYLAPIGGAAFRELLFDAIDRARPARGLLSGGVTFCSMVPLCTLPFRVVCLVGLGDGELPRREVVSDFDLIAHGPEGRRIGDRSRRSEDRYLFLEAIVSARERLIITYTGQSIRDNAALPPSVLVSELCDQLALGSSAAPGEDPLASVIVRHPLQAFSARYFDGRDGRLFSYAEHYVAGAATARAGAAPPFFTGALPPAPPSDTLGVSELVRFFQNPTAYLLNRRLELFLRERDFDVPDREPQELSPLEKFEVGNELLGLMLDGVPVEQAKALILATGAVPLGSPGELDFLDLHASASAIGGHVQKARQGVHEPARAFERRLPSGRLLLGTLPEAYAGGLVEYQFARVRAKHLLGFWIRHLVSCWLRPGATAGCLVGRPLEGDGVLRHQLSPVPDPAPLLERLVARYDQGQEEPLHLFPTTSRLFAEQYGKKQKPGWDLEQQINREWRREVSEDPHLRRVFVVDQTLASPFEASAGRPTFTVLALEVFGPLLEHLTTSSDEA
jgi:exodeoxyribonuclease V gamma subunit